MSYISRHRERLIRHFKPESKTIRENSQYELISYGLSEIPKKEMAAPEGRGWWVAVGGFIYGVGGRAIFRRERDGVLDRKGKNITESYYCIYLYPLTFWGRHALFYNIFKWKKIKMKKETVGSVI